MEMSLFGANGRRKYLNRSEIDAFVTQSSLNNIDVKSFCWTMAYTGCRISEALALTPAAIDFELELVLIRCLKKRDKIVFRSVPIPHDLLALIGRLIRLREIGPDELLWPWCRMTGYRHICRTMEAAFLQGPHVSPKGLRHGFAVQAMQASVPLTVIQRWLGHADIKTTAIYATVSGPEERAMARRLWRGRNQPRRSTKLLQHCCAIHAPDFLADGQDHIERAELLSA